MTAIPSLLQFGPLCLNAQTYEVQLHNETLKLTKKEFLLLQALLTNPGHVITRSQLLQQLWHKPHHYSTNTIDVHIKMLRDKIDKPYGTHYIKTVHGFGYKIEND